MSAELENDKRKRTHRIPVAATSVIALASATGQHIFRKRANRKTAPPRLSADGAAGMVAAGSSSGSASGSWHQQVPKLGEKVVDEMDEEQIPLDIDPEDSGHGGSNVRQHFQKSPYLSELKNKICLIYLFHSKIKLQILFI